MKTIYLLNGLLLSRCPECLRLDMQGRGVGRRLRSLGLPQNGSPCPREHSATLWPVSSCSPGGFAKTLVSCVGVQKASEPARLGLTCLGGMTFPAASCFAAGGVEEAVGGFLGLEFIEKTAAPLHFPPSLPPHPAPPRPILLSVAGCNYAVNLGRGEAC